MIAVAPVTTTTSTDDGSILVDAGGTIRASLISAGGPNGTISLQAGSDILDANSVFDAASGTDRVNGGHLPASR